MIKRVLLLLSLSLLIVTTQQAQSVSPPLQQIQVDLIYLASNYLEGRETGKKGEKLAAEYITSRFTAIGLSPKGDDNDSYAQAFAFDFSPNPHTTDGETRYGKNVIGYLDNNAPTTVVIGAHYDHLGRGAFGSRYLDGPIIHNGADDNASGVAALLYLAEQLKMSDLNKYNYLFIAFSGEEMGLYGSKYFVKNPTIDLDKVNFMLNMDMIGRLDDEKSLVINGAGTSPVWKTIFPRISSSDLNISTTDSGVGASDHTSFYLADIPALHFFTGSHEDYHKPSDDSELINFSGIKEIADWMFELLNRLPENKIEFSKTKDENSRRAASYKVSLGVMPDYTSDGSGMRIDAVLDDRPAQKAGMQSGDIIIQIGDLKVKDVYDYMEALNKHEKGDKTIVKVKRDDKTLEMTVVF